MATLTRDALLQRKYADPKHYPYGFSRSGDYSIKESQLLMEYGSLISALLTGQYEPEVQEDRDLLAVARGEAEPQSAIERAWWKYQQRLHRPKCRSMYASKPQIEEDEGASVDELMEMDLTD